jgi:hypothetical protein
MVAMQHGAAAFLVARILMLIICTVLCEVQHSTVVQWQSHNARRRNDAGQQTHS